MTVPKPLQWARDPTWGNPDECVPYNDTCCSTASCACGIWWRQHKGEGKRRTHSVEGGRGEELGSEGVARCHRSHPGPCQVDAEEGTNSSSSISDHLISRLMRMNVLACSRSVKASSV